MGNLHLLANDKLQLVTSANCTVNVLVFYRDMPGSVEGNPGNRQVSAITTAVTTDILAVPTAAVSGRMVEGILITNAHATDPVNVTPLFNANGTTFGLYPITTLAAGQALSWSPETGWIAPASTAPFEILKVMAADDSPGQNVNTVQPWFVTAGTVTVRAATTYDMSGRLSLSHGATSHTTGLSFTGTATLTAIDYIARHAAVAALTIGTAHSIIRVQVATNIVICAAQTAVESIIEVRGVLRINAGGTFIPNFTFSADPTGAILTKKGSFFSLRQLPGTNTVQSIGPWA